MSQRITFRLNEFKKIARWVRKNFPAPLAFFLLGWLYGLESSWIGAKTRSAITTAEEDYKRLVGPSSGLSEPSKYTEPSEVEGLDIIGYEYTATRTQDKR